MSASTRVLTIPVLICAWVLLPVPVAQAQEAIGAELTDRLEAKIERMRVDHRGDADLSPPSQKPYTVEVPFDMYPGQWCLRDKTVKGSVLIIEVDPVAGTRRRLREEERCLPWPGARDDDEPIAPPTLTAVRDTVARRLPTPTVALNPHHRGLTGLDTWLWYADDATEPLQPIDHDRDPATAPRDGLQVTATAGPYTITATAWIERYRWTFHQPDQRIRKHRSSTRAGSEQYPAATWMPNTKGVYHVSAHTDWRGHYTWSGPAGATGSGDLGTVTRTGTRRWPVVEIRSVLVN